MYVIATAGHIDHGKTTLLRRLTGANPDRLAEEHQRGLTIDLGFVSTTLPNGDTLAFVDVPGHRKYISNALSGIATAPAVLFVVAADQGWQPQTTEHLAAIEAFGIDNGLLVITRTDLADPTSALVEATDRLNDSGLQHVRSVAVSARTGTGIDQLVTELGQLTASLATPPPDAPVRLWIDRAFTIAGSGTVVTGTLTAGSLYRGQELEISPTGEPAVIRGLQTLGTDADRVEAPARVAVNLRKTARDQIRRGQALVEPSRWWRTSTVDVRLVEAEELPKEVLVYCGTTEIAARTRAFGPRLVRLTSRTPLDLHKAEQLLIRDTGRGRFIGARVLDVAPPTLTARGSGKQRARTLATADEPGWYLRQHGAAPISELTAMGIDPTGEQHGSWALDRDYIRDKSQELIEVVTRHEEIDPLSAGLSVTEATRLLSLPDSSLLLAVVSQQLRLTSGRVRLRHSEAELPAIARQPVRYVIEHLQRTPFRPPNKEELATYGATKKILERAVSLGMLISIGDIHLLPNTPSQAVSRLNLLPAPFSVAEVTKTLDTSRRVAIPLLEYLDDAGFTTKIDTGKRFMASPSP